MQDKSILKKPPEFNRSQIRSLPCAQIYMSNYFMQNVCENSRMTYSTGSTELLLCDVNYDDRLDRRHYCQYGKQFLLLLSKPSNICSENGCINREEGYLSNF